MLYFLIRFFQFCLYAVVLYVLILPLYAYLTPRFLTNNVYYPKGEVGCSFQRFSEAKMADPVDVLFLGSSHAYLGFDVRIFEAAGLRTFNLGSTSQTHVQTQMLLRRYLDRLSPKLVVYEVYPEIFAIDGVESALDLIANDQLDGATLRMVTTTNHPSVWNSLWYACWLRALQLDPPVANACDQGDYRYVTGGYVERTYAENTELVPNDTIHLHRRKEQLRAFARNVDRIQRSGAALQLVIAPVTEQLRTRFTNWDEIATDLTAYAPLWEYNGRLELSNRIDFFDRDHLNQIGVEKFNGQLLDDLRNSYPSLFLQ